jgi:hypothetical protein
VAVALFGLLWDVGVVNGFDVELPRSLCVEGAVWSARGGSLAPSPFLGSALFSAFRRIPGSGVCLAVDVGRLCAVAGFVGCCRCGDFRGAGCVWCVEGRVAWRALAGWWGCLVSVLGGGGPFGWFT